MYLIVINRCRECGDELPQPYVLRFGLTCRICLNECTKGGDE